MQGWWVTNHTLMPQHPLSFSLLLGWWSPVCGTTNNNLERHQKQKKNCCATAPLVENGLSFLHTSFLFPVIPNESLQAKAFLLYSIHVLISSGWTKAITYNGLNHSSDLKQAWALNHNMRRSPKEQNRLAGKAVDLRGGWNDARQATTGKALGKSIWSWFTYNKSISMLCWTVDLKSLRQR